MRKPVPLVLVLSLTAAATAQSLPQFTPPLWHVANITGIQALDTAKLTSHGVDDVVFIANDTLYIAPAPDIHRCAVPLPAGRVRDLTTVRTANGADLVWLATTTGLHQVTPATGIPPVVSFVDASWGDTSRIVAGDTDGDSRPDAIGVRRAPATLLRRSGATGVTTTYPLPGPVLDLVAFDWDLVPGDEVVCLLTDRFLVVNSDLNGTLADTPLPFVLDGGYAAKVDAGGIESVALLVDLPGPDSLFALITPTNDMLQVPQIFSNVSPIGLTAGDLDGDGDADLAAAYSGLNAIEVLTNYGVVQPAFARHPLVATQALTPAHRPSGRLGCRDLDGDNAPEVIYAAATGLVVMENTSEGATRPPALIAASYDYANLPLLTDLTVTIDFAATAGLPAGTDRAEMIVWQVSSTASSLTIQPQAVLRETALGTSGCFTFPTTIQQLRSGGFLIALRFGSATQSYPAETFVCVEQLSAVSFGLQATPGISTVPVPSSQPAIGGYLITVIPTTPPPPPPPFVPNP